MHNLILPQQRGWVGILIESQKQFPLSDFRMLKSLKVLSYTKERMQTRNSIQRYALVRPCSCHCASFLANPAARNTCRTYQPMLSLVLIQRKARAVCKHHTVCSANPVYTQHHRTIASEDIANSCRTCLRLQ